MGILAVGLLSPPPARIPEYVDVGRPEVETFEDIRVTIRLGEGMFDATFDADHARHVMDGRGIESGGQSHGLRKLRGAVSSHAMKRLAPPVVCGNTETGYRTCLVDQLRRLLFQGHPLDEVCRTHLCGQ